MKFTIFLLTILSLSLSCRAKILKNNYQLDNQKKQNDCPCSNVDLCKPVSRIPEKEIFGFGGDNWRNFPLDIVTTIAWVPMNDSQFICEMHKNNVRAIAGAPDNMPLSGDKNVRKQWIDSTLELVKLHFFDGITFDYESALPPGDPRLQYYVDIINETNIAFKAENPSYQISVCAAWGPGMPSGIDGRAYKYLDLAMVSDFLYVMQYDTRSQVYDQCIASANCPIAINKKGIQEYLDLGVPASRLVLGVPWYGYRYTCLNTDDIKTQTCNLALRPFRGVNCSDAVGSEIEYYKIREIIKNNTNVTSVQYDNYMKTPYFNYLDSNKVLHQMWYDDPQSLSEKYLYAKNKGLRGVGPFMFDFVDYVNSPQEAKQMFDAFKVFLNKGNIKEFILHDNEDEQEDRINN